MDAQNDFFTLQSLATFTGAVGATFIIANGIQRAFNFNPAWLGLIIAEVICVGTVWFAHSAAESSASIIFSDYFVAVVNGFLVFCSVAGTTALGAQAVGASSITPAAQQRGHVTATSGDQRRHFFSRWF